MNGGNISLGIPVALVTIRAIRRFLDTPARLPRFDSWLARLWVPGAILWLSALALELNTDLLDNTFVLAALVLVAAVAWKLRAYLPARTIGLAVAPLIPCLLVQVGLQVGGGEKLVAAYEDSTVLADSLAFCWALTLVFIARSQKKRLAAEEQRRAEELAQQQLIEAQNAELERLVVERTAALSQQTEELRQALTELKLTQVQLIQAEKMASLGELTAGIAHEIQNPLNFVNNFSEVSTELVAELADECARPTRDSELEAELLVDLKQNVRKITQHGQRAASIVRGMLEHSRVNTGERQPIDLNALADEYLRLAYHGLRAKDKTFNATLHTDLASNLPLVEGVGQDLGRVLLNLFTNAFYAVRQRQQQAEPGYMPTVSVCTKQAGDDVLVQVKDNGTGIPEAVRQKIFQPFFTTKPTGEGTGLGLSLAHDIVVQGHGGTLTVESQEGRGTEFTICLPLKMS